MESMIQMTASELSDILLATMRGLPCRVSGSFVLVGVVRSALVWIVGDAHANTSVATKSGIGNVCYLGIQQSVEFAVKIFMSTLTRLSETNTIIVPENVLGLV